MMTSPPGPDDRPNGHGRLGFPIGPGRPGEDPVEAQRASLVSFWALVLRRFRAYAHRSSGTATDEEGR